MTVSDLFDIEEFEVINSGSDVSKEIRSVFCCDLLSLAMSRASSGCAWVTVMGNVNALAVASLTESACIVLAEGRTMDESCISKAKEQDITIIKTTLPVFEAALKINGML